MIEKINKIKLIIGYIITFILIVLSLGLPVLGIIALIKYIF